MSEQDLESSTAIVVDHTPEPKEKAAPAGPSAETVAEAKRYGWVEKERFKGNPNDWVDATEFVRRGNESLPILHSKLTKTQAQLATTQRELGEAMQAAKAAKEVGYKLATIEWQKKFDEAKAAKAAAIEENDALKIVEADEALSETRAAKPLPPKDETPPAATTGDGTLSAEHKAWFDENQWFTTNTKAQRLAMLIGQDIVAEHQNAGTKQPIGVDFLNEVKTRMTAEHPELVDAAETTERGMTHRSTTRSNVGTRNTKTYENLPPDARAACDRGVRRGDFTKEEYVSTYYMENAQ